MAAEGWGNGKNASPVLAPAAEGSLRSSAGIFCGEVADGRASAPVGRVLTMMRSSVPGTAVAWMVDLRAMAVSIDHATRHVMLRGAEGTRFALTASPQV